MVSAIKGGNEPVELKLNIYPDQVRYIPANIGAEIKATTVFGAKYVNLLYPSDPSPNRLVRGVGDQVPERQHRSQHRLPEPDRRAQEDRYLQVERSTDRSGRGLRGQGERFGEGITAGNETLKAINPRADTVRRDWQALKGFSDAYGAAAHDILTVLDAASTTSAAISDNAEDSTRCWSASAVSLRAVSICWARARTTWSAPSTCSNRRRAC